MIEPRPSTRSHRPSTIDEQTIDSRPATIDPLTTRKRSNVYATDVQRDVMWRPKLPSSTFAHTRSSLARTQEIAPRSHEEIALLARKERTPLARKSDDSVVPERQKRIVVQIHGQTVILVFACKRSRRARTKEVVLRSHARDRQSVPIDMGSCIGNGGGPNAADDMEDMPH